MLWKLLLLLLLLFFFGNSVEFSWCKYVEVMLQESKKDLEENYA